MASGGLAGWNIQYVEFARGKIDMGGEQLALKFETLITFFPSCAFGMVIPLNQKYPIIWVYRLGGHHQQCQDFNGLSLKTKT